MRREAEAAHRFLDAPLIVEVRDARPLVRRSHGCVDVVFDAGLACQRRQTRAPRTFLLTPPPPDPSPAPLPAPPPPPTSSARRRRPTRRPMHGAAFPRYRDRP